MPEVSGRLIKKKVLTRIILITFLLFILTLVLLVCFSSLDENRLSQKVFQEAHFSKLKVIFLDVGQGDAILVITPSRANILIDGGPDRNIIYKLDKYISLGRRKIDLMILTHPDPDHLTGLVEVLKRYKVEKVLFTGVSEESFIYQEFLKEIEAKNISSIIVNGPKNLILEENLCLEILHPLESLVGKNFSDNNFSSIVSKLIYKNYSFLFTGDAPKEIEEKLIEANFDLESEVLKVSHHGAKNATSFNFLEKVRPKYAVISVGKNNRFGHPSLRVLKNLEKIGAQILRTDEIGDIIFEVDKELLLRR